MLFNTYLLLHVLYWYFICLRLMYLHAVKHLCLLAWCGRQVWSLAIT